MSDNEIERIIALACTFDPTGIDNSDAFYDEVYEPICRAIKNNDQNMIERIEKGNLIERSILYASVADGVIEGGMIKDGVVRDGYERAVSLFRTVCKENGKDADKTINELDICVVCGFQTIDGAYDICGVCGWENDRLQIDYPDDHGVNNKSLNEARKIWESGQAIWADDYPRPPATIE